jgi:ABC-2 type transport system ATP-binding protein
MISQNKKGQLVFREGSGGLPTGDRTWGQDRREGPGANSGTHCSRIERRSVLSFWNIPAASLLNLVDGASQAHLSTTNFSFKRFSDRMIIVMQAIEVENLKKYFGKVKALDGVTFDVEKGEVFGFLGPNGAGKTTTIRLMMDFLRPTEGEIKLLGHDAKEDSVELKGHIGYLSPEDRLYKGWTAQEHVDFIHSVKGNSNIADKLAKDLELDLSKKVWQLSTGNRQKLSLVLAMMSNPDLLIMDEPTAGLDPILSERIYQMLDKMGHEGKTIFMSSHNLSEVEKVCSKVAIIKEGKLVATEHIADLKRKKMYSVTATFEGDFEASVFKIDGVEIKDEHKNFVELVVKGDINPVVQKLSQYQLKDLEIQRATLEDIFLEFYK